MVRLEVCHQPTLHCVTYCSPIITAERLPGGPESPSDMNPATNAERRNEQGEEDRMKSLSQLHGSCSGLLDSESNSIRAISLNPGGV